MAVLTKKEEAFCKAIAKHGEKEKVTAYKEAGYSTNMSTAAIGIQADKLFNKPRLNLRIRELQAVASKIAEKKFNISIEKRLKWLEEIVVAGLSTYSDQSGNSRRESLTAARSAIETLNTMLGTGEDDANTGDAINITFNVAQPVKDVKVTRGE